MQIFLVVPRPDAPLSCRISVLRRSYSHHALMTNLASLLIALFFNSSLFIIGTRLKPPKPAKGPRKNFAQFHFSALFFFLFF